MGSYIREMVNIDDMQFADTQGRGTTDAIFIVRQMHLKYIAAQKPLYFAFVDVEKALDQVPRKVLWRALRSFRVEKWAVLVIQAMYANALSHVRVNGQYSKEFGVGVGYTMAQSYAHFSSILCLRHFRVNSALGWHGNSSMRKT